MDFRKFAIEASKIINARYNIIERYNPSFPLGFPYEIDYIRKPNIFKNTSDSSSSLSTFPHKTTTLADLSKKQVEFIIGQLGRSYVENFGEHKTPINKLDFTNKPVVDKNSENDATYLTSSLYTLVNKIFLNIYTKPSPVSIANTATDGFRVSNYNLSNNPLDLSKYRIGKSTIPQPINLNRFSLIGYSSLPVDPLILDLNGDGAKAVSYNDFSVLFDIDNDGGSLEETGWLSHQDGLLVRDLNNNGKIDNMSEVFSEYYAGRAGRNGEAGEKPFANGFEALKSLDSNKDNVFDSKDRDFNAVRVWQDANHNGITDAGELKTLKQLGITAIKLDYEEKGGQLFNGNELLAKGSFTRNGKQQEVVAVNFLANPRGHRISNANGGKKTVTEASGLIQGTTGWTAVDDVNRDLSAVTLGVENIQAGNGNDVLRGDAKDNWLAGGGGADTFYGGDGNDVFYEYKRQEEDKVFSKHATEVAGIMVAERNGEGGVGIAYNAKVASHWVGADVTSLNKMKRYDVANHSWGHRDNFRQTLPSLQA
ncbi:hypothetical protein GVX81_07980 [[Haemophilus] felis]|uniref:Peptidase S8/S53 domain-containing protein n=1 Tax=[Haemophilus] felis TaxID=123822 RepID=A0A1T0B8L9_9PAST|nr:hypothetical protein [[Haemophilus] felis]OOS06550.1 hypothetical protein B0188_02145 [[Haemophilus] felis]